MNEVSLKAELPTFGSTAINRSSLATRLPVTYLKYAFSDRRGVARHE